MPTPLRHLLLRQVAIVVLCLYVAWTVVITPRIGEPASWAFLIGMLLAAVTGLWGMRPVALRRAWAPLLLVGFWAIWAAMLPLTTRWSPGNREVGREVTGMTIVALISVALVLFSRGDPRLVRAFRWGWLALFLTTLIVAAWEITTMEHLLVTRQRTWDAPGRSPAATFINPNNYACVLVVMVGVSLQWASEKISRLAKVGLIACAVTSVGLIWQTASRSALLFALVQIVLAATLWASRRGWLTRARRWGTTHTLPAALAGLAAVVVVGATFLVPALARINPVLRMIRPADATSAASDDLRLALTKAGLRYSLQNPWRGTGAASFEDRLARDKPAGVFFLTNMHNGLLELLSQYGVFVAGPFLALLLLLAWRVIRPRVGGTPGSRRGSDPARGRGLAKGSSVVERRQTTTGATESGANTAAGAAVSTDVTGMRYLLAAMLVSVLMSSVAVSSTLTWPAWWLMVAHACALGWALSNVPAGNEPDSPTTTSRTAALGLESAPELAS